MSIQRYKSTPAWFDGAMQERSDGEYVLYADHVAALAEVTGRSDEAIYNDGYLARLQEEYVLDGGDPYREAYRKGYTAGLSAARDAVAVIREPYLHPQYDYAIEDALAVIDALREAPHVDPCDCDKCRGKA